ncbi:MAG TPA: hypothetical protein VNM67_15110 [Thermoanaerobaculia bacterium]|jgi:hypothetical protein|nr:hypothetical protein [Thermoanaerobaculia bacterium]
MSESNSYAETVTSWEQELIAAERNAGDLPQAEIPREKLQGVLNEIRGFAAEQAVLTANKQEATKRIYLLLAKGRKISTLLRTIVREHYGNRSEKLAEFGMQPLRGRPRNPETPTPIPE